MKLPLVSVIVPNYNHEKFLAQRLTSVINQSYQNFELIILDDCSTDNSKTIIELYRNHPKVSHIVYNTTNSGSPFKQWQKGVTLAKGRFIWIAESDDYCDPLFLEQTMQVFQNNTALALVYVRSDKVDEQNTHTKEFWPDKVSQTRWKTSYCVSGKYEIEHYLRYRNTIPNASACVFKTPQQIDWAMLTKFKYTGDWVFWMLVIYQSDMAFISETLNHFRHHANTTRTVKNKTKEMLRFKEYVQSVHIANSLIGTKANYNTSQYNWMFKQLKTNKINILDFLKQWRYLSKLVVPYVKFRLKRN